jgi:hypothetical protein
MIALGCTAALALGMNRLKTLPPYRQPALIETTLSDILSLEPTALVSQDIALLNLLCAHGLPGAEDLDVKHSMATLDQMAARTRAETDRHAYRFRRNPAEFDRSEGFFKVLILVAVLAEDFGVHYAPAKAGPPSEARQGDGFFADAHDVFLHGLTGAGRQGTCSFLPVLRVAVGRRLVYPLKLVTTKGHLFVRWEDAQERFNVEAAGQGVEKFADDSYRHWPQEVTEEEVAAEGYLRSLKVDADEDSVGGDDAADCLRYLLVTKAREVRVRKLRGL